VAAATALLLSLSPKFGALIATIPAGVLGGAATVLYGMVGVLGARIWVQNKVNFADPINLTTAAIALIIGIANYTWSPGAMTFEGIALGTVAAIGVYRPSAWHRWPRAREPSERRRRRRRRPRVRHPRPTPESALGSSGSTWWTQMTPVAC
jgi:xanthine/uracil permease